MALSLHIATLSLLPATLNPIPQTYALTPLPRNPEALKAYRAFVVIS